MKALLMMGAALIMSGCVQYEYSQFRTDNENLIKVKTMYIKAVQTCDGKDLRSHQKCSKEVEKELLARFSDRKKAFMTKADVARIIATQLIIEYQLGKSSKQASRVRSSRGTSSAIALRDGPNVGGLTSKITSKGVCVVPNIAPSISLSSFTVIRGICR